LEKTWSMSSWVCPTIKKEILIFLNNPRSTRKTMKANRYLIKKIIEMLRRYSHSLSSLTIGWNDICILVTCSYFPEHSYPFGGKAWQEGHPDICRKWPSGLITWGWLSSRSRRGHKNHKHLTHAQSPQPSARAAVIPEVNLLACTKWGSCVFCWSMPSIMTDMYLFGFDLAFYWCL
jgi:hypothetical protein